MATGNKEQRRKRHHYVPEAYLRRWADEQSQVAVRRRGTGEVFHTKPLNVALESNLYTLYGPQDEPDDAIERALSDYIDGPAPELFQELADKRCPRKTSRERLGLSNFLAIQLARTPDHIGQIMFPALVAEYAPSLPVRADVMRQYLTEVRQGALPSDSDVKAARNWVNGLMATGRLPTKQDALEILFRVALENVAPLLHDKAWSVEIDPEGRFITSDLPVSKYGRRPSGRATKVLAYRTLRRFASRSIPCTSWSCGQSTLSIAPSSLPIESRPSIAKLPLAAIDSSFLE